MNQSPSFPWRRPSWLQRLRYGLVGLLALAALSWLAVPPLAKGWIESVASDQLGRQVTLGGVDFHPWSLTLVLHKLSVATADNKATQFSLGQLTLTPSLRSLLHVAPVLDQVAIDQPQLHLTYFGQGRYDVDDILRRLSTPAKAGATEPLPFALHNISVTHGAMDFADQSRGRSHVVKDVNLTIPLLSNLPSERRVFAAPSLSLVLNGSSFQLSAQSLPFDASQQTTAHLSVKQLDLAPYLPYWPDNLPARLQSAVLDGELKLDFAQQPHASLKLSGQLQASHVRVTDTAQGDLLSCARLSVALVDVQPLAHQIQLGAIDAAGLQVKLLRDRRGQLNWRALLTPPGATTPGPNAATSATVTTQPPPWTVQVASVGLHQSQVAWQDDSVTLHGRSTQLGLADLDLALAPIEYPLQKPMAFQGHMGLSQAGQAVAAAQVQFQGQAGNQSADVQLDLSHFPLAVVAPYLAQRLTPELSGTLQTQASLHWRAATAQTPASMALDVGHLGLDQLALTTGGHAVASMTRMTLEDGHVDLMAHRTNWRQWHFVGPKLPVQRDAQGHWMFESWLRPSGMSAASAQPNPSASPGWDVAVSDLVLSGGKLAWLDLSTPKPVSLDLAPLAVHARSLQLGHGAPGTIQLNARLSAPNANPGTLSYVGSLGLNPLQTQGQLDARRLPLHALAPYLSDTLNIELLRADASAKGQLQFASAHGPLVRWTGDSAIEDFRANTVVAATAAGAADLAPSEELLSWKLLNLKGMLFSLDPSQATQFGVQQTTLSDFYARVIVAADGRINLQDLLKPGATPGAEASASTIQEVGAGHSLPQATARHSADLAPVVNMGPITLLAGQVKFSDRFIQPNYSADLSDLNGRLSAFSSTPASTQAPMAELELHGRAQGTAKLQIVGKLNPLTHPLTLDLQGQMHQLELPPLSAYSVKYAGYGIERGKLSMDVNYKVLPDGQLTANNKLVLNQLSFGDKVDGASANLPVKLAVALLSDTDGVIDLDLPLSGSINDPQFRLGPLVFKVVVNIIGKAITAPFSLLSHALGGNTDELSVIGFAPGSASLAPQAQHRLDQVAAALAKRPALKLTVVGMASHELEAEAYKRERLNALVLSEKRRELVTRGASTEVVSAATLSPDDPQYVALLTQVYQRVDMPKPRNLIGMLKDIPVPDMEALLLAHIPVNDDLLRELAVQRGVAVKDYLAAQNVAAERLFLGAAKTVAPEAKWSPRAELTLDTR